MLTLQKIFGSVNERKVRPLDRHGLDGSWDKKLSRAEVHPDFTLDLHGHITGEKVSLTDAIVAYRTNPHRDHARCGRDAARIMRLPLRGQRVSVSVAPSFAIKWLVPRLERFKALHPDIEVWVSADMGLVDFAVADVDLAIRYGAGGYADSQAQMLLTESVVPICSPALIEGDGSLMMHCQELDTMRRHKMRAGGEPEGAAHQHRLVVLPACPLAALPPGDDLGVPVLVDPPLRVPDPDREERYEGQAEDVSGAHAATSTVG